MHYFLMVKPHDIKLYKSLFIYNLKVYYVILYYIKKYDTFLE